MLNTNHSMQIYSLAQQSDTFYSAVFILIILDIPYEISLSHRIPKGNSLIKFSVNNSPLCYTQKA